MALDYLSYHGLTTYDSELKEYIQKEIGAAFAEHIIQEDSFLSFPVVGQDSAVYIDKTAGKIYRWDSSSLKYYGVGSDYNQINLINGNF